MRGRRPDRPPITAWQIVRALLAGAITAVCAITALATLLYLGASELSSRQSEVVGTVGGYVFLLVVALSIGATYAWTRSASAGALVSLGTIAVGAVAGATTFLVPGHGRPLEGAELDPPVIEARGDSRVLVQSALGFEMPLPPELGPLTDPALLDQLATTMPEEETAVWWMYVDPARERALMVTLARDAEEDDADLVAFLDGMIAGARGSYPPGTSVEVERRAPTEAMLRGAAPTMPPFSTRIFLYRHEGAAIAASVTAIASEPLLLEPFLLGARGG